jgi:hypothetical protein
MEFQRTHPKSVRVVRWILFLPAAILAAFLVGLCITDSLVSAGASDFAAFALLLFSHALQGAVFVVVGSAIAPDRQREVGWWLAAALGVFAVGAAYQDQFAGGYYTLRLADIAANPAGGFWAAFLFRRKRHVG